MKDTLKIRLSLASCMVRMGQDEFEFSTDNAWVDSYNNIKNVAKSEEIPWADISELVDRLMNPDDFDWDLDDVIQSSEMHWDQIAHPELLTKELLDS